MKKSPLLNAELSYLVAKLGHTDKLTIADAGLPIPDDITRIDLALMQNIPSFLITLEVISQEMQIEAVTLADEIKTLNSHLYQEILTFLTQLESAQNNKIRIHYCNHEQFKAQIQFSKGIVRTGECSPFANIILHAGVTF